MTTDNSIAPVESLDVKTTDGNSMVVKAIRISTKKESGDARGISHVLPEDSFVNDYGNGVIAPPFDMFVLATMEEQSSILGPCLDAMAINIEGLGHRIVPKDKLSQYDDTVDQTVKNELATVDNFFANAVLEGTLTGFREKLRRDLESTGNAYIECIPSYVDPTIPAGMSHLPSWTTRLCTMDKKPTKYEVPRAVRGSDNKWTIHLFPHRKNFRRYVQRKDYSGVKSYFKEWGDPRVIDYETGEVLAVTWKEATDKQRLRAANPVIHLKLYCPRSPYGLPRYIGNLFTIYGSREAEKINYTTLKCNNVPALLMMVTNARLTPGSITRIKEFVEERIQGDNNYSTILLVEAEPISEGMKDPGTMKMEVTPLTENQHTDAMFVKYTDRNDDKVRQSFRLPPIFLGRADEYNRACYSSDTETLTINGWKNHWEIADDEEIAAYNPTDGSIHFVVPDKKYTYHVENELMYHFHGKTTDCLVTSEHKMIVKPSERDEDVWDECRANLLPYSRFSVPLAASKWGGYEIDTFDLPKTDGCKIERGHSHNNHINGDDWLEFLGYFISEGSLLTTKHYMAPYYVGLFQKDHHDTDKIRDCLNRLEFSYSELVDPTGLSRFQISNRCLRDWLYVNVGTHAQDKRIPWEYLNLTVRQLRILFDAMMLGDGTEDSRAGRTSKLYNTSSEVLAGQVQRLLIQMGYRSVVGPGTRSLRVSFVEKRTACLSDVACGRIPSNVDIIRYTGEVYCYSVPDYGFFVTRRNGRVAIQGNTADASRKLAEEQVFLPERNNVDSIFNITFVPALGAASVLFRSNTPNVTDNYELTQLLAVAERSGGLSPFISRLVVEDVLGRDLPDVDSSIPSHIPFTLTMLREQLNADMEMTDSTKALSDDDVLSQLKLVKELMEQAGTSPEAIKSVSHLIGLLELGADPVLTPTVKKRPVTNEEIKKDLFTRVYKSDTERHIIGGAVLVPGAVDLQGDTYDAVSVEAAAHFWLEHYGDSSDNGIKLMHQGSVIKNAARPIESYVLTEDTVFKVDSSATTDDHPLREIEEIEYPKGTWMLYAKVLDEDLWNHTKAGEYLGWSIGGIALVQQLKQYIGRRIGSNKFSL